MLDSVRAAIAARPRDSRLLLLSDFDGTLAAFDPNPDRPRLPPARRQLLASLAARDDLSLGLVSGRRIADLRPRTQLPACVYHAGLHGMEIEVDDRRWQHPEMNVARETIRSLSAALHGLRSHEPALHLEDKGASLAVHLRRVEVSKRARLRRSAIGIARPWLDSGELRQLDGSSVVEFLPNIECDKGRATRWIAADVARRYGRPAWVVFLGDDRTDEDAFRAIDHGLGVLIGDRHTAAHDKLSGISQVDELLKWLARDDNPIAGHERS